MAVPGSPERIRRIEDRHDLAIVNGEQDINESDEEAGGDDAGNR